MRYLYVYCAFYSFFVENMERNFNIRNKNVLLVKSSVFHFVCGAVPLDWNSKDVKWVVDILMLTCEPAILNVRVITYILFTFIWVKIFGEKVEYASLLSHCYIVGNEWWDRPMCRVGWGGLFHLRKI